MRKVVFFVMLAICSMNMYGQELTDEEAQSKKKEINGIKLSEEAVYADVVEIALDDNESVTLAQQKSINLLQTHVIEIFAKRMNMSKADVQEIWDVIDDKCQNIVVRKGDLLRVFSYIMKDAIGLGPKKPKMDDVKEYFGENEKGKKEEPDAASVKESAYELANVMTGGKEVINELPEKKEEVVQKSVEAEEKKEVTLTAHEVEVNVVEEAKPQVDVPAVAETKVEAPEVIVPELCQEMIEQANYNKLMVYLGRKKTENKLMFGNSNKMQYVERCYIALIDKKTRQIVGVLDKGMNERMNFVTKQMDHFKNYKNGKYAAILVQEF